MIGYMILVVVVCAVAAFVLWPLLRSQRQVAVSVPARIADLQARRQYLVQAIRDVDFDYASGKMLDDEYQETRGKYIHEAAVVLRDLEKAAGGYDEAIDMEIMQLRALARNAQLTAKQEPSSS
ncbi:MAG TPA: hypothetical protein VHA53_06330 [Nitrolancea sp.]|jgi:hypothetical protein|nr:hypothetical protein [Nitrolancea sp.]